RPPRPPPGRRPGWPSRGPPGASARTARGCRRAGRARPGRATGRPLDQTVPVRPEPGRADAFVGEEVSDKGEGELAEDGPGCVLAAHGCLVRGQRVGSPLDHTVPIYIINSHLLSATLARPTRLVGRGVSRGAWGGAAASPAAYRALAGP